MKRSAVSSTENRSIKRTRSVTSQMNPCQRKTIINLPIQGESTEITGLMVAIIDTPEFQRLKSLKQLGTCDHVFPGAKHSRFEHSIGVAVYAGQLATKLQQHMKNDVSIPDTARITNEDIECVKIAGLCHDLGHGPFSHVFEGFISQMGGKWKHEESSVKIFHHLLEHNHINLTDYNLHPNLDKTFIEEIIRGTNEVKRKGRDPDKYYLYDIVNNTRSGLDVDKLDYLQRDKKYANVGAGGLDGFVSRILEHGRVMRAQPIVSSYDEPTEENKWPYMICYPQKLVNDIFEVFRARMCMHESVYQHKTVKAFEFMITDAMQLANDYIHVKGSRKPGHEDGLYRMSDAVHDTEALLNMNDSLLDIIQFVTPEKGDDSLKAAHELIKRIRCRDLYVCLGTSVSSKTYCEALLHKADRVEKLQREIVDLANEYLDCTKGEEEDGEAAAVRSTVANGFSSPLNDRSRSMAERLVGRGHQIDKEYEVEEEEEEEDDEEEEFLCSQQSTASISFQKFQSAPSAASVVSSFSELLEMDDLVIDIVRIHHGMKDQNPVSFVRFFDEKKRLNDEPLVGRAVAETEYDWLFPSKFEKFAIRAYCKKREKRNIAQRGFQVWCIKNNLPKPIYLSP